MSALSLTVDRQERNDGGKKSPSLPSSPLFLFLRPALLTGWGKQTATPLRLSAEPLRPFSLSYSARVTFRHLSLCQVEASPLNSDALCPLLESKERGKRRALSKLPPREKR